MNRAATLRTLAEMAEARGCDPLCVALCDAPRPSKAVLRNLLDGQPGTQVVVLTKHTTVPDAVFELARELKVEVFAEGELQCNILQHADVARHALVAQAPFPSAQLPKMLSTDPVARFFGAQPGQVFSITYDTMVTPGGAYVEHRVVVLPPTQASSAD